MCSSTAAPKNCKKEFYSNIKIEISAEKFLSLGELEEAIAFVPLMPFILSFRENTIFKSSEVLLLWHLFPEDKYSIK